MKSFSASSWILRLTLISLALVFLTRNANGATWAEDALMREAGYIVNCSFTEFAVNHSAVQTTDDAYGAINVDRVYQVGPDWVNPGESVMAAIGLMAAARQLKVSGYSITTYDQVLNRFFQTWLLARKQSVNPTRSTPIMAESIHVFITIRPGSGAATMLQQPLSPGRCSPRCGNIMNTTFPSAIP